MTVVVADLPTREGREAVAFAVQEALRRGSDLLVVSEPGAEPASLADAHATLSQSEVGLRVHSGSGDIAEDLVTAAEQENAEVIVIGLRRRSPIGKLILGTNAQRILLESPCPVLAVKPVDSSGRP